MAGATREDSWGTADAITEEEDTVAVSTATEAMEPVDTATENRTTPDAWRTAKMTWNPEAVGTPGDLLATGRTGGGTTAAIAVAPITAIRMPEEAETAVWNTEG